MTAKNASQGGTHFACNKTGPEIRAGQLILWGRFVFVAAA